MSEARNIGKIVRGWLTLRNVLIAAFRFSLFAAGCCLAYLLFIFGHTDVTPMRTILTVTVIAAIFALIGAMLQWIGLPAEPKKGNKTASK